MEQAESEARFPPGSVSLIGIVRIRNHFVHLPGSFPLSNIEVEKDPEKPRNSHSVLLSCQLKKGEPQKPGVAGSPEGWGSLTLAVQDRVKDAQQTPPKQGSNPVSKMT